MRELKISPSVFAADLGKFREQLEELEANHAELLHVDVMDGHFVERMAFGADHIRMIKSMTHTPLDVHLMIDNPEVHIDSIIDAGADIVTIHQESTTRLLSCMQKIHKRGVKAGVVLSPATSEDTIRYLL
ncbi:MAG: ribulose-phosphate 3-epimerase, partial [Ruminococcus sp.]